MNIKLDSRKMLTIVKLLSGIGIIGFFLPFFELQTWGTSIRMSEIRFLIECFENNIAAHAPGEFFICFVPVMAGIIGLTLALHGSFGYSGLFNIIAVVTLYIEEEKWVEEGYSSGSGWYISFIAFLVAAGCAFYGLTLAKKRRSNVKSTQLVL